MPELEEGNLLLGRLSWEDVLAAWQGRPVHGESRGGPGQQQAGVSAEAELPSWYVSLLPVIPVTLRLNRESSGGPAPSGRPEHLAPAPARAGWALEASPREPGTAQAHRTHPVQVRRTGRGWGGLGWGPGQGSPDCPDAGWRHLAWPQASCLCCCCSACTVCSARATTGSPARGPAGGGEGAAL